MLFVVLDVVFFFPLFSSLHLGLTKNFNLILSFYDIVFEEKIKYLLNSAFYWWINYTGGFAHSLPPPPPIVVLCVIGCKDLIPIIAITFTSQAL